MFQGFKLSLIDNKRKVGVDCLRGIAVTLVMLYHFNGLFKYGYLGVDLFFAISGYLVGGQLIKKVSSGDRLDFFNFFIKRGFKIWPSYYFFFGVAFVLTTYFIVFFGVENKVEINELPRYLLWYRNFRGEPFHFVFDHVWTLCIEEHFYIILPLFLLVFGRISKKINLTLFWLMILGVFGSLLFKFFIYYYTNSRVTYLMTFSHLDGFSWGILIAYLEMKGKLIMSNLASILVVLLGIGGIVLSLYLDDSKFILGYTQLYAYSIISVCSGLILLGFLAIKNHFLTVPFRFIGYYSYNIYLWNGLISVFLVRNFGYNSLTFAMYILFSLFVGVLTTYFIEERFLKLRDKILRPK